MRSVYLADGQLVGSATTDEIIDQYQSDCFDQRLSTGDDPLKSFRKFDSSKSPARISQVSITGCRSDASRIPKLPIGEPFSMQLEIECQDAACNAFIVAIFTRNHEQRVATIFSGDGNRTFTLQPGRNSITCNVHKPHFSPGRYFLEARLTPSPGAKAYDVVVDVPVFDIEFHDVDHLALPWQNRPWGAVHMNGTTSWTIQSHDGFNG